MSVRGPRSTWTSGAGEGVFGRSISTPDNSWSICLLIMPFLHPACRVSEATASFHAMSWWAGSSALGRRRDNRACVQVRSAHRPTLDEWRGMEDCPMIISFATYLTLRITLEDPCQCQFQRPNVIGLNATLLRLFVVATWPTLRLTGLAMRLSSIAFFPTCTALIAGSRDPHSLGTLCCIQLPVRQWRWALATSTSSCAFKAPGWNFQRIVLTSLVHIRL